MTGLKILALSGSLRQGSSNTRALRFFASCLPATTHCELFLRIDGLPHFNPDLEAGCVPAPVQELRDALARSTALLLSCPEYAHGLPGAFKNALDWLVGVGLGRRPVALLNTSPRATHAPTQLREVLRTMDGVVLEEASFMLELAAQAEPAALSAARQEIFRCHQILDEYVSR